ncbi:hypothetical protein ACVCH0_13325 [Burkholderia glumae]
MSGVFIVGLPVQIRRRFEAAANNVECRITSALADVGGRGSMRLVPYPGRAILDLQGYYNNSLADVAEAYVLVLPYAQLPQELEDELDTLDEMGGTVVHVEQGVDGWPASTRTRPDQSFLDALFHKLCDFLFPNEGQTPSEYYKGVAERNTQILLHEGALDDCDDVAPHRYDFMRRAIDALDQFVQAGGSDGRIDAYFAGLGLDHAQSGGITVTLRVRRAGVCVYQESCNTHLKQGDKTTRVAAARVYYHVFQYEQRLYAAVLYAGPHPESDLTLDFTLP